MPELPSKAAARVAITSAIALLLLVLALEWIPRLARATHVITSAPVPTGVREPLPIPLAPGQTACMDGLAVSPESGRLKVSADPRLGALKTPLEVTLRAPGYAERVRVAPSDDHALVAPIDGPTSTVVAQVCVRNAGQQATALEATSDPRVLQRTRASVDGDPPLGAAFLATFTAGETSTPLSRLGDTVTKGALFNALGPWALWALLVLVALAVPILLLCAFYMTARDDETAADG